MHTMAYWYSSFTLNAETPVKENVHADFKIEKLAVTVEKALVSVIVRGRGDQVVRRGSGFVISSDGYVATNLHVIGQARPIFIKFKNGEVLDVISVHASDKKSDLAILKINKSNLPYLKLASEKLLKKGQHVIAMGNPLGLEYSIVSGVISGQRQFEGTQMIQLAIPVEAGNSGGPVLNTKGEVLGVLSDKSRLTYNLGFAVHVEHLRRLINFPNPVPIKKWLTIGVLNESIWKPYFDGSWKASAGKVIAEGHQELYFNRALLLNLEKNHTFPYEAAVDLKLDNETMAAGLVFGFESDDRHLGFYVERAKIMIASFNGKEGLHPQVIKSVQSEHYRFGDWNQLKLKLKKSAVSFFLNGFELFSIEKEEIENTGLGLMVLGKSKVTFKNFKTGKLIPSTQPSVKELKKIRDLIDSMPELNQLERTSASPVLAHSKVARRVLLDQARTLERKSHSYQKMANDLHTFLVCDRIEKELKKKDVSLLKLAVHIAHLDDVNVDLKDIELEMSRLETQLQNEIAQRSDSVSETELRRKLTGFLFRENGFHSSRSDFFHQANYHIHRLLEDKEGAPVTLGVLYMELAHRLGLEMKGVFTSGRFYVCHAVKGKQDVYIDMLNNGLECSRAELVRQMKSVKKDMVFSFDQRNILIEMLNMLFDLAKMTSDNESLIAYLHVMIAIEPELISERFMLSMLSYQTGRQRIAEQNLRWLLTNKKESIDLEKTKRTLNLFIQNPKP